MNRSFCFACLLFICFDVCFDVSFSSKWIVRAKVVTVTLTRNKIFSVLLCFNIVDWVG